MNTKLVSLISFRALSLLLSLQGQSRASEALNKLIYAVESGIEVDEHMAAVAEALKSGTEADWDDIIGRINDEVGEFLGEPAADPIDEPAEPGPEVEPGFEVPEFDEPDEPEPT